MVSKMENDKSRTNKHEAWVLFKRVIGYSRPDALVLGGAFVFLAFAVICEMFIPFYTGQVIDVLGSKYQQSSFTNSIIFMALFSVGSSLSAGLRGGLFMFALSRLNKRVRIMLFKSLMKQEIGFFEACKAGEITSRLSMDTNKMSESVAMNINVLLRSLVKTIGLISLMISLSWKLTMLTLIEILLTGLIQKIYNSYNEYLAREIQDSVAYANDVAGEAISSIKTVRSFAAEHIEVQRYTSMLQNTQSLKIKQSTIKAIFLLVRRMKTLGMQVIMLLYGRHLIKTNQMTTGNLVSFILYQMNVGSNIRMLVYIYSNMLNSVGAAAKVFKYLDRKPQMSPRGILQPQKLNGHVQFKSVSFSYPNTPNVFVLKDISLELKPGEITALVGPSGGGKTTCVCLLKFFYEPQIGDILLDGVPIREYDHKYLHRKIALVSQEPILFSGSVKDNICYGLNGCQQHDIIEVSNKANAHKFVSTLNHKYETEVGERGRLLSAGQKQRIAFARALIRNPKILILDEATSSLDIESEQVIQETLSNLENIAVLVIAHRLKTVENVDKIIVMDDGTVVEQGTHQDLMSKKGCYFRLVQRLSNGKPIQDSKT